MASNLYEIFMTSVSKSTESTGLTEAENNREYCSYKDVQRKAEKLAVYFQENGFKKGSCVGLFIENNIERICVVLALVKSGIIFVPLDPLYNKELIDSIITDSVLETVIVSENDQYKTLWIQYDFNINTTWLRGMNTTVKKDFVQQESISLTDIVCILHTSGSTGHPKGVMLTQNNFINLLGWGMNKYKLNSSEDIICLYSNYTFINYWFEIFSASIYCIPCAVMEEKTLKNFPLFSRLLLEFKVTMLIITPTVLGEVLNFTKTNLYLKQVSSGGEPLNPKIVSLFSNYFPNAKLFNDYGSTETTGFILSPEGETTSKSDISIIGNAIKGNKAYIVDESGKQVEHDTVGELWVSGTLVSKGYVNQDVHRLYFIKNPFEHEEKYAKVLKTGDFVKMGKEGIQFIGRKDDVFKIRGQKVNTQQLENSIKEILPKVETHIASYFNIQNGQHELYAFYCSKEMSVFEIRSELYNALPKHMIPKLIEVDTFPLTPSGKIDKKCLLKNSIPPAVSVRSLENLLHSKDPLDKVKYVTCKVLNLVENQFDASQTFFEHGGDSITIFTFLKELKDVGFELSIKDFVKPISLGSLCNEQTIHQELTNPDLTSENQLVSFSDLTELEIAETAKGMHESFSATDPFLIFHKEFDFSKQFKNAVTDCWKGFPHLCMSAIIKNDIVGAFLSMPVENMPEIYMPMEQEAIFEYCEKDIVEKLISEGHKVASAFALYADVSLPTEKKFNAFKRLSDAQLELLKSNGFTAAVSLNVALATQLIANDNYNSSVVKIVNISEFELNGQFPYKDMNPSSSIHVTVDYLNKI